MTDNVKKASQFIENILLAAAEYTGNMDSGKKQLSASQLSSNDLEIYLKYKHGGNKSTQFEANTFGSIYHLGAELAFKDVPNTETEMSLSFMLDNGWLITGSIDLVLKDFKVFADHKTTTKTSIEKNIKAGKHGQYAMQMAVYKFLLAKNGYGEYENVLPIVDKGFSYYKPNKFNQLTFLQVETHSLEDIEAMLYEKTNRIQEYIDLDIPPEACADRFPYRPKGGKFRHMKCLFYCDQRDACPVYAEENNKKYNSNAATSMLDAL